MPVYEECQSRFNQIQETIKKGQKVHAFLHKEIGEAMDSQIDGKYNHRNEEANYYNSAKLNYYEPDIFNQRDNLLDTYYV